MTNNPNLMNKKAFWVVFIVLAVIIIAVMFMGNGQSDTVSMGVIVPLTGTSSEAGNYAKRGVMLAVNYINNDDNKKIKIDPIIDDSHHDGDMAVSELHELIDTDHVKFVIGAYSSSVTAALAPVAEYNKVILISPASQADDITYSRNYVFRTQIAAMQDAQFLASTVFDRAKKERLDILTLDTYYRVSYLRDFLDAYTSLGGSIGSSKKFSANETDFRSFLMRSKDDGTKNILIIASADISADIMKEANDIGMKVQFYSPSVIESDQLLQSAGPAADGLIYPYPYDDLSTSTAHVQYQNSYSKAYGAKGEMIAANSYDAVMILSNCFEEVGTKTDDVANCLYNTKGYEGASGMITFDKNGDVSKPIIIKTVKDGKFTKLK